MAEDFSLDKGPRITKGGLQEQKKGVEERKVERVVARKEQQNLKEKKKTGSRTQMAS